MPFFLLTAYLFWKSIQKLKVSKAHAYEAGMLKPSFLWTILILNILLVMTDVIGIFDIGPVVARFGKDLDWIYNSCVVVILLFVQVIYVYILSRFEITDYTLRTVVTLEGVEIVGMSVNEEVIFKFRIDPEKLNEHGLCPGMYKKYYPVNDS